MSRKTSIQTSKFKVQSCSIIAGMSANSGYEDRKSTRLNSSHGYNSYAVFCLEKKKAEFPSQVACRKFKPPDWFGRAVTCAHSYINIELVTEYHRLFVFIRWESERLLPKILRL